MLFGDKIKILRKEAGMTQQELANKLEITSRSLLYYEKNNRYPKSTEIISKLCEIFNVSSDYLMTNQDEFVMEAADKYGSKGKHKARQLVSEANGLFAGGELKDEDKDLFFKAITEIYWKSKEINKKYTPKKFKSNAEKD